MSSETKAISSITSMLGIVSQNKKFPGTQVVDTKQLLALKIAKHKYKIKIS